VWREQLADLLCTTLLLSQPHNHSKRLHGEEPQVAPYYVRRVEGFVEAHADEAITMPQLVAVAGVSARALQAGFRRYRDTTPMGFLRGVRLERAHQELRRASHGATVAQVAMRFGLTHLGRFSTHYRQRFGESPSETLRQSLAKA
jgi:AraC-like DNA-binding protein